MGAEWCVPKRPEQAWSDLSSEQKREVAAKALAAALNGSIAATPTKAGWLRYLARRLGPAHGPTRCFVCGMPMRSLRDDVLVLDHPKADDPFLAHGWCYVHSSLDFGGRAISLHQIMIEGNTEASFSQIDARDGSLYGQWLRLAHREAKRLTHDLER